MVVEAGEGASYAPKLGQRPQAAQVAFRTSAALWFCTNPPDTCHDCPFSAYVTPPSKSMAGERLSTRWTHHLLQSSMYRYAKYVRDYFLAIKCQAQCAS